MRVSVTKGRKAGFSLIEVALMLLVVGGVVVLGFSNFATKKRIEHDQQVLEDLKVIREALYTYAETRGYFPCPASEGLSEDDPKFGTEHRGADGWCQITSDNSNPSDNGLRYVDDIFSNFDKDGGHEYEYSGGLHNDDKAYYTPDHPHSPKMYDTDWRYPNSYYDADNSSQGRDMKARDVDLVKGTIPCVDIGLPRDCMISPEGYRYDYVAVYEYTREQPCHFYAVRNLFTTFLANDDSKEFYRPHFKDWGDCDANKGCKKVANYAALPASGGALTIYKTENDGKYYRYSQTSGAWVQDFTELFTDPDEHGQYIDNNGNVKYRYKDKWTHDLHYFGEITVFHQFDESKNAAANIFDGGKVHKGAYNDGAHFVVWYSGRDGVGAKDKSGSNYILPQSLCEQDEAGNCTNITVGSSLSSQVNYQESQNFDGAFYAPAVTLDSSKALDDILLFGRSKFVIDNACAHCQFLYPMGWQGDIPDQIVRVSFNWNNENISTVNPTMRAQCYNGSQSGGGQWLGSHEWLGTGGVTTPLPLAPWSNGNEHFCREYPQYCEKDCGSEENAENEEMKVLSPASALTGNAGNQYWGEVRLIARDWNGDITSAIKSSDGIGIPGGRFPNQIDYLSNSGGISETVTLIFPEKVKSANIILARQFPSYTGADHGNDEVGAYKAYDANANLLDSGILIQHQGIKLAGDDRYRFEIEFPENVVQLVISAAPYNGNNDAGYPDAYHHFGGDNSEYSLLSIEYTSNSCESGKEEEEETPQEVKVAQVPTPATPTPMCYPSGVGKGGGGCATGRLECIDDPSQCTTSEIAATCYKFPDKCTGDYRDEVCDKYPDVCGSPQENDDKPTCTGTKGQPCTTDELLAMCKQTPDKCTQNDIDAICKQYPEYCTQEEDNSEYCKQNPQAKICTDPEYCAKNPKDPVCQVGEQQEDYCTKNPYAKICTYVSECSKESGCSADPESEYCQNFPDSGICQMASYCQKDPGNPDCEYVNHCANNPSDAFCQLGAQSGSAETGTTQGQAYCKQNPNDKLCKVTNQGDPNSEYCKNNPEIELCQSNGQQTKPVSEYCIKNPNDKTCIVNGKPSKTYEYCLQDPKSCAVWQVQEACSGDSEKCPNWYLEHCYSNPSDCQQ